MKGMIMTFLIGLTACGPSIQYVGRSYPATTNVDVYFNASDITKPYEVIGKVEGQAWPLTGYEKIQEKIVEEAKKKGADGVIFTAMQQQVTGTTQNTTTNATGGSTTKSSGNTENGKSTTDGWNASVSTTTTTNTQTEKIMRADFIKYK